MKIVMLLGIGTLAIASTGCTTLTEIAIVGKAVDHKPMSHKDENYTVVKENGSTIFKLSAKGKTALSARETKIEQMKARRKARRDLCVPLPELETGLSPGRLCPFICMARLSEVVVVAAWARVSAISTYQILAV